MKAIIKRELKAYFSSPLGYAISVILLFVIGKTFSSIFKSGYADVTYVFSWFMIVLFIAAPLLTMGQFAEERRLKTDQLIFTSPVKFSSVILGKFFATFFYVLIFEALIVLLSFLFFFFGATPDISLIIGNLIGLFLCSGALLAVGLFFSALTESQLVAAVCSLAFSLLMLFLDTIMTQIDESLGVTLFEKISDWVSFTERYSNFTKGIFDIGNFVFFISIIAAFLFFTARVIDRKRWA